MRHATGAASFAILGVFMASPLTAQVTPEEVWQSWQSLGKSYGQTVSAEQVGRAGDTLVVSGMKTSMAQDGATIDGRIEEVRFRDLGDGTVEVTMTDTYSIDMSMPGEEGNTHDIAITLAQPGLTLTAGGNAARTDYAYTAPSVTVDMQIREDAVPLADVDATLTGLSGSYAMDAGAELSALDSALAIDSMTFTIAAGDATNGATAVGSLAALKLGSAGSFLGMDAVENMAQALRDGFSADIDFSYGRGDFTLAAFDQGRATKVGASNETGHFRALMGQEALRYGAGGTGVSLVVSGADIPFPELKLTFAEASFDFLMPLLASEMPTDFTFLTRIVDLTVSDEIWAMLDPTVALPRDPATVILDTKGKVRLISDLMDETAMAALGDRAPGELHALDVTDLTVKFAGAELTGTGGLTFDNSDLTSFDGVPAPTGTFDLLIRGGNGLLDRLVTMGVVPQNQAMGARMMIAMLAKPGDGPDVLTSTLEFRDKGFYANGQRLK